jgi:hypothetical protein
MHTRTEQPSNLVRTGSDRLSLYIDDAIDFPRFPRSNYIAPKTSTVHRRCAAELCNLLGMTPGKRTNPYQQMLVDVAFYYAGVDKGQHLQFLTNEILAHSVRHIFAEAHDNRQRINRRSLNYLMATLKSNATNADDVKRNEVSAILRKSLNRNFVMICSKSDASEAVVSGTEKYRPQLTLV